MLFLPLPTAVVHRIDAWSPLAPDRGPDEPQDPRSNYTFPEPPQRQVDTEQGGRVSCTCDICGESFEVFSQLEQHLRYCVVDDRISGHDLATTISSGETFTSVDTAQQYCEVEDDREWSAPSVAQQLKHSKMNHATVTSSASVWAIPQTRCRDKDGVNAENPNNGQLQQLCFFS